MQLRLRITPFVLHLRSIGIAVAAKYSEWVKAVTTYASDSRVQCLAITHFRPRSSDLRN